MGVTCCSVCGATFFSGMGTRDKGGGCLGLGGDLWCSLAACGPVLERGAGFALGTGGACGAELGAARGRETGRAVQAAPCLCHCGKGAELPSPSLVPWPILPWCRKHGFGTAAIKSKPHTFPQRSRTEPCPLVCYGEQSTCKRAGAEGAAPCPPSPMYRPSGAPCCCGRCNHGEPGTALALTGWWLGSAS